MYDLSTCTCTGPFMHVCIIKINRSRVCVSCRNDTSCAHLPRAQPASRRTPARPLGWPLASLLDYCLLSMNQVCMNTVDHVAHHDDQLPLVSVPDAKTATQLEGEARSTNRQRRDAIRVRMYCLFRVSGIIKLALQYKRATLYAVQGACSRRLLFRNCGRHAARPGSHARAEEQRALAKRSCQRCR